MPTKRKRRGRHLNDRITPAAVEHFREALDLQDLYAACQERNGSNDKHDWTKCRICSTYREHWGELHRELRLKPYHESPLDIADGDPPEWYRRDGWEDRWELVQGLKKSLEESL